MKKIIIINGSGESGKDTVIELTKEILKDKNIEIHNISSIDLVKFLAQMMGWDNIKDDKSRKLLSNLKDLWINYNNGPFNYIINEIKNMNGIIFIHIREPEEIKKLVDYYDNEFDKICDYGDFSHEIMTLLIKRNHDRIYNNHADLNVNDYLYDYEINNDDTIDELKEKVKNFLFENVLIF